jgi:hypothetical protein
VCVRVQTNNHRIRAIVKESDEKSKDKPVIRTKSIAPRDDDAAEGKDREQTRTATAAAAAAAAGAGASSTTSTSTSPFDSPGFIDGNALFARFNGPLGVACDKKGFIYVADTGNHAIRRINPGGSVIVETLAGHRPPCNPIKTKKQLRTERKRWDMGEWKAFDTHTAQGDRDGPGDVARFRSPSALAFDEATRYLFICDTGNHKIRYGRALAPIARDRMLVAGP